MTEPMPEASHQPADRAQRHIEHRVMHVIQKLRRASDVILQQSVTGADAADITAADLERCVPYWRDLVPAAADVRAALLHQLAQRYALSAALTPASLQALGYNDPAVEQAHIAQYGTPVMTLLTAAAGAAQVVPHEIVAGLEWMYLRRGETLVEQGAAPDRVYALLEGLLRADQVDADGRLERQLRLEPGELVGSLNLLTGEPHAATIVALRDCDIVYMTRNNFERYVTSHPDAMRVLAVRVINQLRKVTTSPQPSHSPPRTFAVLPATGGLDDFSRKLVAELTRFGATYLLTAAVAEQRLRDLGDSDELEASADAYHFVDWLEQLEAANHYVVYMGDPAYPNWTRRCIEQSERILITARADGDPARSPVEQVLADIAYPDLTPPVELVLVHATRANPPRNTQDWLAVRDVARHHHVALDSVSDFQRLSRHLRGRAVGIVFGGGGMRGLAHAGVIRALEERDIACDLAGGTSSGAIVAALYGLGHDAKQIQIAAMQAMDRRTMFQPTLPLTSLVTGHALNKTYAALFGAYQIEDLWTPVFTIAANLTRARMTVKASGSLQKAVRASTSLAGILPPAIDDNYDLLLDGGAFNNTPADVMREQVGSGTVIAVDLGYTRRDFPEYAYNDEINGFRVLWSRLNPFVETIKAPAIMDIMMRSNGLGGMDATQAQVAQADLVIHPPVTQFGLYDIEAADEIFAAGYTYGLQVVDAWISAGGLRDTFLP